MEDQYSTFLSRRCADWVDYSHAAPFQREKPRFRVKVENGKARFELDQRYATVEEARKAVEDYVLAWNVSACCTLGPDFFRLEFEKAVFSPGPQPVRLRAEAELSGISHRRSYPKPPSDIIVSPDVESIGWWCRA